MLIKILIPNFDFKDERGSLTQLCRTGYKQINVITSVANSVRGGHYHQDNDEAFFIISGELKLEVWNLNVNENKEEYVFREKDMFCIPKNIVHSFTFTRPTILVSMYSKGVELSDGTKDILLEK